MNCLAYALRFWEKHPEYKLFYNSNHVINLPFTENETRDIHTAIHFLPAEDFGYSYFKGAFKDLLDNYEKELLKKYFKVQ